MSSSTTRLVASAAVSALALGAAGGLPSAQAAPVQPRAQKVAYLTFDDGPTSTYTPQVLSILRKHRAKATFFMIGRQAAARPDLVRRVRAEGHAVGNHTWDHPRLVPLPAAEITSQFGRTNAALGGTHCMRPPGGAHSPRVDTLAKRQKMTVALWNVDTRDWARPGTKAITTAALGRPARGGAPVILFHDGGGDRVQTVTALPRVLDSLARQGYRFETLPICR